MSKPPFNPVIFKTDPHGEQALRFTEGKPMREGQPIAQQLFTFFNGTDEITLTGEELDSLAAQWRNFKEGFRE